MKNETVRRDRTISVTDIFLSVIQRWRMLLVVFAVFAIVIGIIGTYKKYVNETSTPDTIVDSEGTVVVNTAKLDELRQMMTAEELGVADDLAATIKWYYNQIEYYRVYNTESIFGQLDPDNINTVTLQYFVGAEKTDDDNYEAISTAICKVYLSILSNDSVYEEMTDAVDDAYTADDYRDVVAIDESESSKGIFKINAYGLDSDMTSKMADVIEKYISSKSNDAKEVYKNHELRLLSREQFVDGNAAIREKQLTHVYALQDIESYIPRLKAKMNLTDTQLKYTELLCMQSSQDNIAADERNVSFISLFDIKSMIIGGIFGMLLAALFMIIKYITDGRIHNSRDVENDFKLPVLCSFADETTPMRKYKCGFDKWITKSRQRERPVMNTRNAALIAVARINVMVNDNNLTRIAVVIDSSVLAGLKIVDEIAEMIQSNVTTVVAENILIDENAFANIETSDGVIVVVQSELTQYDHINNIIDTCKGVKCQILGAIVAE